MVHAVRGCPTRREGARRRYRRLFMPGVLDIEQALLLLELEPPFDQRDVQLARRRLAKVWHPDLAPPGKQFEHERHLKAINEAADQLIRLAEGSRGGGPPPLGGGAAPPGGRGRPPQARPVRLADARPLGCAPLRALPVLSRV